VRRFRKIVFTAAAERRRQTHERRRWSAVREIRS
jgi:hypothetical protein